MGELQVISQINNKVSLLTVDDLSAICATEGVTVESVMKALADGLQANVVPKLNNEGEVIEASVVADMYARHKYMQSALEVLRLVRKDVGEISGTVTHQMAEGDIDRLEAIANELLGLEKRLSLDKVQQGRPIDTDAIIRTE